MRPPLKGQGKSPSQHYGVMDIGAIKALPVREIASPDALLAMWVDGPLRPEALDVPRRCNCLGG
ncbi:S-adenosylmethionine-binding domain-containing protein [Bosea sp. NBC_00550]|uniref:S-adenosylmethionine-binding domain-containing protein n=1 Tax=Bosea sp. NBC_00550 TaxID=2969621 RepID=UPI00222FD786|nr:S-adenosylmethionine-binding domain-containing protein [Bosea sp. NBC_00550]UZF93728.1 S-adenosylmethionine-binding domain-containing protein [Bosea sp. NBC_00550]